jgi:S1-C subfamily serine protease
VDGEDQPGQGADGLDGPVDEPSGDFQRGWISPDDRLWRHPSEAGRSLDFPGSSAASAVDPSANRTRISPLMIGGATAAFVVVLVAVGMVVATTATNQRSSTNTLTSHVGPPTTDPGLDRITPRTSIAAMVATVRPSTVALRIRGTGWTRVTTGLVAESGGIIVTPSAALAGARSVTAIEPDGTRDAADLVGIDPTSGLAVVRIEDDLPAATFDDSDPAVGTVAFATGLNLHPKARSHPASLVYEGMVVSTGQALDASPQTAVFSATAVRAPLAAADIGCPLVAEDGHVVGMLTKTEGTGSSTMAVFLPADLVFGVAFQLVESGAVEHGWLGIRASNAITAEMRAEQPAAGSTTTSAQSGNEGSDGTSSLMGALVDSVQEDSPAARAGLLPGDVITAINGDPVHSAAELLSRLYPDPPGTELAVSFERSGSPGTISVILIDQDGDAPGDGLSP